MKPEKRQLLDDLFDDGNRRDTTLVAGARILRRRRYRRVAGQTCLLALLLVMTALWLEPDRSHPLPPPTIAPAPRPSVSAQARSLTDDELLALFPTNTPVGLVTLSNGKKQLVFPRPGDGRRFVSHL